MTLEDLGNIGELVGAVGVVVSLVYLAIQIRQNTRSVRAASYQEAIRDIIAITDNLANDPDLARVYWKGLADFDSLDVEERRRFTAYLLGMLRRMENVVYQTKHGALDAGSWVGVKGTAVYTLSRPGAAAWWKTATHLFSDDFVRYVENELMADAASIRAARPDPETP